MPEQSPLVIALGPGNGLEARSLEVTEGYLLLTGCAMDTGASMFLPDATELSAMETTILGGRWCKVTLHLGSTATLKAITHRGGWLTADLGGTEIVLEAEDGILVNGQPFVLELGAPGWLDPDGIHMAENEDRTLGVEDPETEILRTALIETSALYLDVDGNGVLGSDEREAAQASPPSSEPAPSDTGDSDTGDHDTGTDSGRP